MKKYLIANVGCDDTSLFEIELNDDELKTIIKFAEENNKNKKEWCQPFIEILDEYNVVEHRNYDKYDKRGKHYIVEYKDEDDDDE